MLVLVLVLGRVEDAAARNREGMEAEGFPSDEVEVEDGSGGVNANADDDNDDDNADDAGKGDDAGILSCRCALLLLLAMLKWWFSDDVPREEELRE